jgi:hypothetical protein
VILITGDQSFAGKHFNTKKMTQPLKISDLGNTREKIPNCDDESKDLEENGFYISGGKYFTKELHGKTSATVELSNFVGKSLFHLVDGSNNSKRIIQIQRDSSESYLIEVKSSEMKIDPFETIIKSIQCTFFGNNYQLKKIMAFWMNNEVNVNSIETLGYNREHDIYIFSNGVFADSKKFISVNDAGIADVKVRGKKYYIPSYGLANVYNPDFDQDRKYLYLEGNLNFENWAKLYFDAFQTNGGIGMLYLILSIFWDIIMDQVGFFPFLFLFGAFGTGKTKLVEYLLRIFGNDFKGISLGKSSSIGLSRTIASRNNSIFYLKEYTPETDLENQDLLLCAYDGAGRATGIKSNDNKTRVSLVRSAIILDGNHLPTSKTAVLSRMILLNAENNKYSVKQQKAYNELEENQNAGFGLVFSEINELRSYFKDHFKKIFFENVSDLRKTLDTDFAERTLKHVALILTPIKMLHDQLNFPFTFEEIKSAVIDNANEQNILLNETDEITIFWQAVSSLIKNGVLIEFRRDKLGDNLKGSHYNVKNEGSGETVLQIKPKAIFPEYVKYCKNNNIRSTDYNTLIKLLTSKANSYFIQPTAQNDRSRSYTDFYFKSCYQFKVEKNENTIKINTVEIDM